MKELPTGSPLDKALNIMIEAFGTREYYDRFKERFPTFHNKFYRFSAQYLGDDPLIAAATAYVYTQIPRRSDFPEDQPITKTDQMHLSENDASRILTRMNWYPYPSFYFQAFESDVELTPSMKEEFDFILEHEFFVNHWSPVDHSINVRSSPGIPILFKDPPLKAAYAAYMLELLTKFVGPIMTQFYDGKLTFHQAVLKILDQAKIVATATVGLRGMTETVAKMNERLAAGLTEDVYANMAFTDQAGQLYIADNLKFIKNEGKQILTPAEAQDVSEIVSTMFHKCRSRAPANIGVLNSCLVPVLYPFLHMQLYESGQEYRAGEINTKIPYLIPDLDKSPDEYVFWSTDITSMEMKFPTSILRYFCEAVDAHLPETMRGTFFTVCGLNIIAPTATRTDRKRMGTPVMVKDMMAPDALEGPHLFGHPSGWELTNGMNSCVNKWANARVYARNKGMKCIDFLKNQADFQNVLGWLFSGDDFAGATLDKPTGNKIREDLASNPNEIGFKLDLDKGVTFLKHQLTWFDGHYKFFKEMAGYWRNWANERSYGMTLYQPSPFPNVGLYARRETYRDNPVAEQHFEIEDEACRKFFKHSRLEFNHPTPEEMDIINQVSQRTPEALNYANILNDLRTVQYDDDARETLKRISKDLYDMLFMNFPVDLLTRASQQKYTYNGPNLQEYIPQRFDAANQYRERLYADWKEKYITPYAKEDIKDEY